MSENPALQPGEEPGDAPPLVQASSLPDSEASAEAEDAELAHKEHLRIVKDASAEHRAG